MERVRMILRRMIDLRAGKIEADDARVLERDRQLRHAERHRRIHVADPAEDDAAEDPMIALGIVPAAMEIMDRHTTSLVEEWLHIGLPTDAAALLLIEVDGPAVTLEPQLITLRSSGVAQAVPTPPLARREVLRARAGAAR